MVSTMAATPWGGSEELWSRTARLARAAGHEVDAFVHRWPTDPDPLRALADRGVHLHRRRRSPRLAVERLATRVAGRPVHLPTSRLSHFAALRRMRPDVVLLSEGTFMSFLHVGALCDWLAESGTPYVVLVQQLSDNHRPDDRYREDAARFYGQAARVLFVSRSNRESAERQLATHLPRADTIQNPFKLASLEPVPRPEPGPARLACVARLAVGDKGQDVLLQALAGADWAGRDWRLRLYGTGGDEPYLRALARLYGVADRVDFAGHVEDVRAIWAANEMLVLSSRAEGTPLALIEAMLCGRPAIVTDVGGNAEWVTEGETGFVAPAPTAHALRAALARAWDARDRWAAMGEVARERALARADLSPERALLATLTGVASSSASRR